MKLSREAIQRMISQKQGTSNVTVINQDGGGGGGVTLGPLLTSLNAEAMPSAEGYLHWSGTAWEWTTPTGGDPVDLTPYALKTWVQTNYASNDDIADFITLSEAEDVFAAIDHTHDNYLPLTAGANKALTGSLYITGSNGIQWAGSPGAGMLCYMPSSGWTGISASQWGVGATSAQGVIRSNANDILHYRNGTNYKVWDAYNFTPSDYLPLTGGTVESLTVTNDLDADSITVGSLVNSNTMAEYLDSDAMQTWLQQQGYITQTTADGRYIKGVSVYGSSLNPDTNRVVNIPYADINTPGVIQIGTGLLNDEGHTSVDTTVIASREWADGRYLPLTGGIVSYVNISNGHVGEAVGGIFNLNGVMTLGGESVAVSSDGSFTFNGSQVATQPWVAAQLGGYLPLTGGSLSNDLTIASNKYLRFGSNSGGLLIHNTTNGNNSLDISANRINLNVENGLFYNGNEVSTHSAIQNEFVAKAGSSMTGALSMGNGINVNFGDCSVTSNGSAQGNIQAGKILKLMGNYVAVTAGDNADANFTVNGNIVATRTWVGNGWKVKDVEIVDDDSVVVNGDEVFYGAQFTTNGMLTLARARLSIYEPEYISDLINDSGFISQTFADGRYLPLTAGSSKPLTGSLYVTPGAGTHQTVEIRGSQYNIGLTIGAGNVNRGLYGYTIGGSNDWLLYFNASNTILNYGNVGIGTTTPDSKLHVANECHFAGGAKFNNICIEVNNSIAASGRGSEINNYNGKLLLQYNSSTDCSICKGGGNVGIGTTSPAAKLDVNGSVKIAGSLTGVTTISTSSRIFAGGDIETKGSFVWCDSQNFGLTIMEGLAVSGDANYCCALFRHKPQVQLGSDMLEVVVAKSDENGIEFRGSEDGTYTFGYGSGRGDIYAGAGDFSGNLTVGNRPADADQKLYVGGSAVITGNIGIGTAPISTYAVDVDGSVRATSFVNGSDIRMKDVTRFIEPSVHDIAIAPIIEFAWKKGDGSKNLGTIAQYWQTVFPQAVHEGGDGMLSIEYANIALASAITAARHSLDNERRIAELELRVAELEDELAAMVSQQSETNDN